MQSGGRAIPREELAALLWPRGNEDQARASLRQELAVLKKALTRAGIDAFIASKSIVRFSVPAELADTTAMETGLSLGASDRRREAVALYGGDFLSGLNIRSGPYEEWIWLERQRLRNRAIGGYAELLQEDEAAGESGQAMATAQALLAVEGTQEQAHRALMRLYHSLGRRAEALRQFDRCRDALRRDLDAEPSRETFDLAERIRRADGQRPASARDRDMAPMRDPRHGAVLCAGLALAPEQLAVLGPEAFADAMERIGRRLAEVATDYGGTVLPAQGDRCLAVFADPGGSVHATAAAALAGLALTEMPVQVGPATPQFPRVGLDHGDILERPAGTPDAMTAFGRPLHVAAQLEKAAAGGEVLVSEAAQRLIRARFDIARASGSLASEAFLGCGGVVLRQRLRPTVFDAAKLAGHLTPFVGRQRALAELRASWRAATDGPGRVLAISGTPGIGKSRLLHAFLQEILDEEPAVVPLDGSPFHRQSPYEPILQYLRGEIGLALNGVRATDEAAVSDWAYRQTRLSDGDRAILVDLLCPSGSAAISPTSRAKQVEALISALDCSVDDRVPIVLVEDFHWFDPASAALVEDLASRVADRPGLVLITLRPGTAPAWLTASNAREIALEPLAPDAAQDLARAVLSGTPSTEHAAELAERAKGVPLAVEEMAAAIQFGSGQLQGAGGVQEALTARIAVLPATVRDVLQIASVFGPHVDHNDLLAAIALPADALHARLRHLQGSGLMFRIGRTPDIRYAFKHVLVREAVYAGLMPERRATCHLRIAEVLEARPGGILAPEVIARHFAKSGRAGPAIALYEAAGRRAAALAAHLEAAHHFRAALRLVRDLPDDGQSATELRLLLALGPLVQVGRGFASDEVVQIYERARSLAGESGAGGRRERLEPVLWGLWVYCMARADLSAAIGLGAEFLAEAQTESDPVSTLAGTYMLGVGRFYRGHLEAAEGFFDRARRAVDGAQSGQVVARFGLDLGVGALCYLAWTAVLRGDVVQAEARARAAVTEAKRAGDPATLLMAQVFAAGSHAFAGEAEASFDHARAAFDAARAPGQAQWRAQAQMQIGRARWLQGDPEGAAVLRRGLDAYRATGAALAVPYAQAWLAEACLAAGAVDEGLARLDEAAAHAAATSEVYFDAEIARLRGCLLARHPSGRAAEAEAAFALALQTATSAGAGLLSLRSRVSLAEFLESNGRHEGALSVLDSAFAEAKRPAGPDLERALAVRREILSAP
ncbi:MAG: BTAD domain-containing putative transcriptional regulator [Rhodobacter sp.]|nr:BTAD domain-containing putative transcriptional regulator [Rhodobacter sp.]